MIFAKLNYEGGYEDWHDDLVEYLSSEFIDVKYGFQSDSWIWINIENNKVDVDSFTSHKHWIKSDNPGNHVETVIKTLMLKYPIIILDEPENEPHE